MERLILGIELGSTRIKAVLTDGSGAVIASGSHVWENKLENGLWTYSLEDVRLGLQASYKELVKNYGKPITNLDAVGVSAMMHGYLAFDGKDNLLVPFRTWRNTNTARAAEELTERFCFNVPQRWSVAHYYQAVLGGEKHAKDVEFLTTLAGYVHYKLTGRKVLGVGDASGMFPLDGCRYDGNMLGKFNELLRKNGINKNFENILPEILLAGENAGTLTKDGAKFLDPSGSLKAGAVFCPPEGDAGTGMVATDSISPRTANVSAGTSAFLTAVLERPLKKVYKEIDILATPEGKPAAMVHINNCTSEINAWTDMFSEVLTLFGVETPKSKLMEKLFMVSEKGGGDTDKLIGYNFLSGEPIAGLPEGRPLTVRRPECKLCLADFMKMQIYSSVAALRLGTEILQRENVAPDCVCGHGGFFKTQAVGQKIMAAALDAPVTVMENAGEGGAWGIALLALYTLRGGTGLQEFLDGIFKGAEKNTVRPDETEKRRFDKFMIKYKNGLGIAKLASEVL